MHLHRHRLQQRRRERLRNARGVTANRRDEAARNSSAVGSDRDECLDFDNECSCDRIVRSEGERWWFEHGKRTHGLRTTRRREKRDDAAVGMSDEMGAAFEKISHIYRIDLEILGVGIGAVAEPPPIHQLEVEVGGERFLRRPSHLGTEDISVDEHDPRSRALSITSTALVMVRPFARGPIRPSASCPIWSAWVEQIVATGRSRTGRNVPTISNTSRARSSCRANGSARRTVAPL